MSVSQPGDAEQTDGEQDCLDRDTRDEVVQRTVGDEVSEGVHRVLHRHEHRQVLVEGRQHGHREGATTGGQLQHEEDEEHRRLRTTHDES